MMITVQYKNGKTGQVETYKLSDLIRSHKIKKFLRSEGWVTISKDPIREIIENHAISVTRQTYRKPR